MKTSYLIGSSLIALLFTLSCSSDTEVPEIIVPEEEQEVFDEGINFETQASEKSVSFTANADWTIDLAETRSNVSWCTVFPRSGKAGKNSIQIKTEVNDTYDDRSVVITLNVGNVKKTIMITQKQKDALIVTSKRAEVDAKGGNVNIQVKSNIDFEAVVPATYQSWISSSSKSRGLETSDLSFAIAESKEAEKREGEIIIKGGAFADTVRVYQTGQKILLLTANECAVPATGGNVTAEVKSNFKFGVKMPSVDWIKEETKSRGVSSHTLQFMVEPNEHWEGREASIVFFDQDSDLSETLHIKQEAKNTLLLSQNTYNVDSKGADINVEISSNIDYDVTVNDDWIVAKPTRGLDKNVYTYTILPNETLEARTGTITVAGKEGAETVSETISIVQAAKGDITISQTEFEVQPEGGTISVEVASNVDLSTQISQNWVEEITSRSSSMDKKTYQFKVAANETFEERTAEVNFFNTEYGISKSISITQLQQNSLEVAEKSYKLKAKGGEFGVKISGNVEYDITVNDAWIAQKSTRGISEDMIYFTVEPNETTDQRTGSIIIASKDQSITHTISVEQEAKPTLMVETNSYEVKSDGETIEVKLLTNINYEVKVNQNWIEQLKEPTSRAIEEKILRFKVLENKTFDNRTAEIEIFNTEENLSQKVSVKQLQKDDIQLSDDYFTLEKEGGNFSVTVKSNIEYDVHIDSDWLTQTTSRALNENTLQFTATPNETDGERMAVITIGNTSKNISKTITVVQTYKGSISVSQHEYYVSADGETLEIKASSNVPVSLRTNQYWLSQVNTRALEESVFYVQVDANNSYDERTAEIELYNEEEGISETITVIQVQRDALLISKNEYKVKAAGETINVKINRNVDYSIQVNDSWIKQVQTRGLVEDNVKFIIEPNATTSQRTGTITVTSADESISKTITIKQIGKSEENGDFGGSGEDMPWS